MEQLVRWLEEQGLDNHIEAFAEHDIDFDVLPHLTDQDLVELGLSIGDRRRLAVAIADLDRAEQANAAALRIPAHPADPALFSRATMEGERKHATVLFADIVDSTRLTYGKDADEADIRLSPAIDAMRNAVFRYEGYVRPRGDGIQGIFGVPLAHEDHALRGCYAALDMLSAIAELNKTMRETSGEFIQVRIGLNSGELLVKGIQDDLLIEIDAVGPMIALASRMESLSPPGTAQITAETMALVEGFVDAECIGNIPVKGVDEPVTVYQLKGARALSSRFHGIAARGLTRFIGREHELTILARSWIAATTGQGSVIAVDGEPGVGKSRLFWEFAHSHGMRDALILEASSVSYGRSMPYLPMIDLVRGYFNLQATDDSRTIKEQVNGKLMTLDENLLASRSAIFALLGLEFDDPEWRAMDPIQRRHETIGAITGILLREASLQPLCLIFEDLHWIDAETEAVLDSIVDALPTTAILLLINHRPEYACRWTQLPCGSHLPMLPLQKAGARELLDGLLGQDQGLASIKDKLFQITQGNPFYLEETVQTLKELNVLSGTAGSGQSVERLSELEVPASVQSTLEARIDRLDPDHKHVLHYAAAIGKVVPHAVLAAAIDLSDERLRAGLSQLQDAAFLYQTKDQPDREYTFKHALTFQVAYQTLTAKRRQSIHNRILRAMEAVYSDSPGERIEQLADHAFRGEAWIEAVRYGFKAGRSLYDRSANSGAKAFFAKALAALERLPASAEHRTLELDVRLAMRQALLSLGEIEGMRAVLDDAEAAFMTVEDPARKGQFEAFLSGYYFVTAKPRKAVEHGLRAAELARTSGNFQLEVESAFRIGQAYYYGANFRKAIDQLEVGVALLEPDRNLDRFDMAALPSVICRTWLVHSHTELGAFGAAFDRANEAVGFAEETQHPSSICFAHWSLGHVHLHQRSFPGALLHFRRALDACRRWGLRNWFPRLASAVGIASGLTGQPETGLAVLRDARATLEDTRHVVDEPMISRRLSSIHHKLGDVESALSEAKAALALSRKTNARCDEAWALILLARIHADTLGEDPAIAETYVSQALSHAVEYGMKPLEVRCHEIRGHVLATIGRHEDANEALRSAADLANQIGMKLAGSASADIG